MMTPQDEPQNDDTTETLSVTSRISDSLDPETTSARSAMPPSQSPTLPVFQLRRPQLPAVFGRYKLLRRLGQGGMGSVFLAEDSVLERFVSLKMPRFETADDDTVRQRFLREAKIAATLSHPQICPIYDVGQIGEQCFISMEYIEGRTLTKCITSDTHLPVTEVTTLVGLIAAAMHEAHQQGIVHRDLKSQNIMVSRRGQPVVLDFGLARRTNVPTTPQSLAHAVVGTPGYMAPEQVCGEIAGPEADIYGLGVVLYELLTNQRPFRGPSGYVFRATLQDPPLPPSSIRKGLDSALEQLCLQMLAKAPADRPRSMQTIYDELSSRPDTAVENPSSIELAQLRQRVESAEMMATFALGGLVIHVLSDDGDSSTDESDSHSLNDDGFEAAQEEWTSPFDDLAESELSFGASHSDTTPAPTEFGTPEIDQNAWDGQQSYPDTCAIRCQEFILEQFTGTEIDERALIQEAIDHGWYTPGHGTSPQDVGNVLELHGIEVHRYTDANVYHLASELAQGHKVIVGVDSGELWNQNSVMEGISDSLGIDGADHAVVVSGIDTSDADNVQVIVSDPGTGDAVAHYPLDQFLDAWADSDFFMMATNEPAPASLPEMVNFNYGTGHIDTVAGMSYEQFTEFADSPQDWENWLNEHSHGDSWGTSNDSLPSAHDDSDDELDPTEDVIEFSESAFEENFPAGDSDTDDWDEDDDSF